MADRINCAVWWRNAGVPSAFWESGSQEEAGGTPAIRFESEALVELLIVLIVRWIHIASATLAIGAPFFVRYALLPAAAKVLDDDKHQQLRAAINARWRRAVYALITLFILTGLVQFLVPIRVDGVLLTARWKDFSPADRKLYHMVFGFKMIAAFGIFFLASALAGRSQTFAPIRKNAKLFLGILLLLAAVLLACSSTLHYLPREPLTTAHAVAPSTFPAATGPARYRQRPRTRPSTLP